MSWPVPLNSMRFETTRTLRNERARRRRRIWHHKKRGSPQEVRMLTCNKGCSYSLRTYKAWTLKQLLQRLSFFHRKK